MTDHTTLACSAKDIVARARRLECDIVADNHEALANALLACQLERDELAAERDRLVILCDRDKTWLDLVEDNQRLAKACLACQRERDAHAEGEVSDEG